MPKTKEQKRKERELGKKRRLDQSRRCQVSVLRPREFPEVLFLQKEVDVAHVDPGFVAAVKKVAGRINFKDISKPQTWNGITRILEDRSQPSYRKRERHA